MKAALLTVSVLSVAISGCSDPKAANKDNFSKALSAYLDSRKACIETPVLFFEKEGSLVAEIRVPKKSVINRSRDEKLLAQMGALKEAGLVTESLENAGEGTWSEMIVHSYRLTKAGTETLGNNMEQGMRLHKPVEFCYGDVKITSVQNFTDPAPLMGMTVSQVDYQYKVSNVMNWAKSATIQAAFKGKIKSEGEEQSAKALLVKTDNGWVHEKMK